MNKSLITIMMLITAIIIVSLYAIIETFKDKDYIELAFLSFITIFIIFCTIKFINLI